MTQLVYDIETTELPLADKIHMIVTENYKTRLKSAYHDHMHLTPRHGSIADGVKALEEATLVVGHNIKGFDEHKLKELCGYNPRPDQVQLDTLVMSRTMYPDRFTHKLEDWMKTLKMDEQKIQNEDWSVATQRMLDRCISDVGGNTKLLIHMFTRYKNHFAEGTDWMACFMLEQDIVEIHQRQMEVGIQYDVELAKKTRDKFDVELKSLRDIITDGAPQSVDSPTLSAPKMLEWAASINGFPGVRNAFRKIKRVTVAKPFKKDGQLTAQARKPFMKDEWQLKAVKGPFSVYKRLSDEDIYSIHTLAWFKGSDHLHTLKGDYNKIELNDFDPDSDTKIKAYLFTLGWQPDEYNVKKMPDGSFKTNSPKLSESSFGSLPPGLGQTIKTYRTLKHRRGMIQSPKDPTKGALAKVREDGRVSAEAITCGTPTARYTHSGAVCNIPRPSSPYGREIRQLFRVPDEHWMLGVDLSGIEARMLAHFCYNFPGGPEFASLVLTDQDGGWHQANADLWGCERNDAKSELYALMYGAGPQKLGNILGKSKKVGAKNKKDFFDAYTPYADLVDNLMAEHKANGGWIKGLDGRRLYVRHEKDTLNTCLQGNSAILFKHFMRRVATARAMSETTIHQLAAYHDELQMEVCDSDSAIADSFGKKVCDIATEVGQYFHLNVKIEAESITGRNWADCH